MVVESNYAIASCFFINITRGYTPVNQRWYMYQRICRLYFELTTQRIHLPSMTVSHQEESVRAKEHLRFAIDMCNNGWSFKGLKKKIQSSTLISNNHSFHHAIEIDRAFSHEELAS